MGLEVQGSEDAIVAAVLAAGVFFQVSKLAPTVALGWNFGE